MAGRGEWRPPGEDEGEEEEDEIDEQTFKHAKDAVLFAINVSNSMLENVAQPIGNKKTRTECPVSAALKCAYSLMQQRIIARPNDMMGILLYGTKATKSGSNDLTFPNCYLLTDLGIPSAEDVKALRIVMDEDEDVSSRAELLTPSTEPVPLSNVLFAANQLFTTRAPNFASRRLFIVTDEDDPDRKDPALKSAAAVRAKDLYDLGITIELFPIYKPDHVFDRTKFYEDVIYSNAPTDPEAPAPVSGTTPAVSNQDGISLLQSLLSAINSKSMPRRSQFAAMPLEIGPGFRISVKGFMMYQRQNKHRSCYVWLEGETPQIATASVEKRTPAQKREDALTKGGEELHIGYKFGGEYILFTEAENKAFRHFESPIIRVIGFKPASSIPIWANTKPATFLYPTEELVIGSTRVFAALLKKLQDDKLVALVWFVARKNTGPIIAALFPSEERLDETTSLQVNPPGLWLSPLPFADDIRQNPESEAIGASEALIDRMRDIVQLLQLPKARYDPVRYPNPALQRHYQVLQAMALEDDLPDLLEDKTVPKFKAIAKRTGALVTAWGEQLEKDHLNVQMGATAKATQPDKARHQAPVKEEAEGPPTKKRILAVATALDDQRMQKAWQEGTLARFTVADIKAWLAEKELGTAGNKSVLVDKVQRWFDEGMGK